MKKKSTITILIFLQAICMYGQKTVSIYELGDSIGNYETNFENLIHNWTTDNITNADEYKLFRYAFVETITDSVRYNYYRNYFSGDEMLMGSASRHSGEKNGHKFHELNIKPGYAHSEFYDSRGMNEKQKTILSDDFRQKAKEILTRDFNIDKVTLKHYSYEFHKADTIRGSDHSFSTYRIEQKTISHNIVSPDSISANYIDVFVLGKKTPEQFETNEIRRLLLEQLLIERTQYQLLFNMQVHLGDMVYAIRFEYNGKLYTNYVICSSHTKKVVMDYFFKSINVEQPNYLIRTGKGI